MYHSKETVTGPTAEICERIWLSIAEKRLRPGAPQRPAIELHLELAAGTRSGRDAGSAAAGGAVQDAAGDIERDPSAGRGDQQRRRRDL